DAVLDVDDQVSFFQVAKIGRLVAKRARPPRSAPRSRARTENVLVRIQGETVVLVEKAGGDLADEEMGVHGRIEERTRLPRHDVSDASHQLPIEQEAPR